MFIQSLRKIEDRMSGKAGARARSERRKDSAKEMGRKSLCTYL